MTAEAAFLARLRTLATHPAARGFADDAAVVDPPPGRQLVLTHDMIVEGIHYLPADPPADVAWKLLAVNLSDLAAKGADPLGVLLGYTLGDPAWDAAFIDGLAAALAAFDLPLLGGDTVASRGPRTLGLTAIGHVAPGTAPDRRGARAGDELWVAGIVGDAGLGLRIARGDLEGPAAFLAAYRRPQPLLAPGRLLAPHATAMADVSDGLLIDAARIAAASNLALTIDLAAIPRSAAAIALTGDTRAARLAAATAGDDYALILAAPRQALATLSQDFPVILKRIGSFAEGAGLTLHDADGTVPTPARLGYEHDA